jgi:rhodanese-related sulfurtransferase
MSTASVASLARSSFDACTAAADRPDGRSTKSARKLLSRRVRDPLRRAFCHSAARRPVDTLRAARRQYSVVAVPRISKEDLKQRLDGGDPPVIIDARLKYPYEHSTVQLPGAIRYGGDIGALSLPRDREVVVYDSDPNELASTYVVASLIRQGYRAVALKGGISEWLAANLPTDTKQAPKQAAPEPGALKG